PVVPGGDLGQPVIGDHEGTGLGRRQVIEAQSWYLNDIEHAGSQDSAVTGNYLAVAINQDRDDEPEKLDALGDLPDLFLAVPARVGRIGEQCIDSTIHD